VDKHIKCDLKKVEKPDSIFHDKLLGKGSKVFKHLELGTLPVEFVMKKKRLKFLKYILDENKETMISQVYEKLKTVEFVYLLKGDM